MSGARAFTREEIRSLDRRARDELGIPTLLLMENAGAGISRAVCAWLAAKGTPHGAPVAVVCGKGGNGGDGLVLARHLAIAGHDPRVALAAPAEDFDRKSDAFVNLTIVERMRLPLEVAADGTALSKLLARWSDVLLVADALLGTGLSEAVREPHRGLIDAMNGCGRPVVAVDVPSGLDVDRGVPLGVAVRAAFTITLAATKVGFELPCAREYTGPVEVVGIGTPVA